MNTTTLPPRADKDRQIKLVELQRQGETER
jgi:hypothetical protein